MYHGTPAQATDNSWDVAMPIFRAQVRHMLDRGCKFIRFSDAMDERYYGDQTYVSLTFDDGYRSNADAFDFLHSFGIVPTAFIVSRWIRRPEMISSGMIVELGGYSEFGGHGATHDALTGLSDAQLREELQESKSLLEGALQRPVTTMSAPGGRLDDRVIDAAHCCGFRVIGNSVSLINDRPHRSLNRFSVRNGDPETLPVDIFEAGALFWLGQRARRYAVGAATRCLGDSTYKTLRRLLVSR